MTDALAFLATIGDADPTTPGTQPGLLLSLAVQYVLPVLGSLLIAAGTWATAKLGQWAHAKTGSEKLGQGIERAGETASAALAAALADVGPALQRAAADGVVTRSELAGIATDAAAKMAKTLGVKGLELVRQHLGIADVTEYLRGKVILEAQALGVQSANEIKTIEDAARELNRT